MRGLLFGCGAALLGLSACSGLLNLDSFEAAEGGTGGEPSASSASTDAAPSSTTTASSSSGSDGGAGPTTDASSSSASDGGGGGIGGDASSSGQSGTVTTGAQCDTPDDCPGEESECTHRSCEGNQCSVIYEEDGFLLARQTAGDCLVQVCDGRGDVRVDADDGDVPAATRDCVIPVCDGGIPGEVFDNEGASCDEGGGRLCTGDGRCVECLGDGDCGSGVCNESSVCVSAACDDGERNGDETDIDCGGTTCPPCANGGSCVDNSDCISSACEGTCQPSCSDGEVNNDESDVDCGGSCPACDLGLGCGGNSDCSSDFCLSDACQPAFFFSEYVEGSANNKALEIFNYGNATVDASATGANCSIQIYPNGATSPSVTITLDGSIDPFDVWVVTHASANASLSGLADQTSASLNFNGDDALELVCGGVVLDVIGQIGVDPGTGWGSFTVNTLDRTLRRDGGIFEGDRDGSDAYDPTIEWDAYAIDEFSGLGVHP